MTPTRIAIATDVWHPQVNGVVTTLERTAAELGALGFEVLVLNPGLFRTVPCPSYPSIQNRTGVLHEDLPRATLEALKLGGEECIPTPAFTRGDAPRRRSPP